MRYRVLGSNQGHVIRAPRDVARNRRGSLLVEVAMAGVMLMIAMGLTVKMLSFVAIQRRAAERRQQALLEAGNLMERITGYPYEEVSASLARKLTLSPQARQALPESDLVIDVAESQGDAGRFAKRIAIRLRWRNRAGEWDRPVRLTSWIQRGRSG
jgi:hypothetical protein